MGRLAGIEQRIENLEYELDNMAQESTDICEEFKSLMKNLTQEVKDPDLEAFSFEPFVEKIKDIKTQVDNFSDVKSLKIG